MKTTTKTLLTIAMTAALTTGLLHADDEQISKIMKAAMKGDTSLFKTICTCKGTPEDAKKLSDCLNGLKGTKAPKGDQAAYDAKLDALLKAAADVAAGNKEAQAALGKAGNCKACHSAHKPD